MSRAAPTTHPALRLDVLSRISNPLRLRRARSGAKGSVSDLELLAAASEETTPSQAQLLLPVFYANLDASAIPTAAELDAPKIPSSIECAIWAIRGLPGIIESSLFPPDASTDLWRRFHPWLFFLHTYRDDVARRTNIDLTQMYFVFGKVLAQLHEHQPTGRLIDEQAGVQAVCTRLWMFAVDVPADVREATFANTGCRSLPLVNPARPVNFGEILDEAGGLADLAAFVVKHLVVSVPNARSSSTTVIFFSLAATFMKDADTCTFPLHKALQSAGIIGPLIKGLLALNNNTHPMNRNLRASFVLLLNDYLVTPSGMAEALDAGLLRLLMSCADLPAVSFTIATSIQHLLDLMKRSLVHLSVVLRMEKSFGDLTTTTAFRKSVMYPQWQQLERILKGRCAVLKKLDAQKHASLKACDNLECEGPFRPKAEFMRCGWCSTTYYCSTACQTVEWKTGGHREVCEILRSVRLRETPSGTRDRSFFRALVHHEYLAAKADILRKQITFSQKSPKTAFYTSFDYDNDEGTVSISILPIPMLRTNSSAEQHSWTSMWNYHQRRVAKSGGKIDLHLVAVGEGPAPRRRIFRMFVMRSATAAIHEARERLVQERMSTDRMARELRDIAALDVLEIH
ncbi:hypothetical protein B0H17DRAFT_1179936 [Mycena rosella]|uniref:MYND-type domain-containing protein n=1 Tax=Mycena rosella TaxID=1033263 RepID=A0AAD7DH66_MYCRO|nr:hypothetical protein B0H17DRAFT_1179936 [Mycena rosella]